MKMILMIYSKLPPMTIKTHGLIFIAFIALYSSNLLALELHGYVTKSCSRYVGMTIHVSENNVILLDTSGRTRSLSREDIELVATFNVLVNPLPSVEMNDLSHPYLREIYLENSKDPSVLGWPVRFIEDLVIFYSIDGRSHVYTLTDIFKLRPAPTDLSGSFKMPNYKAAKFDFSESPSECPLPQASIREGVRPTRLIADKISINEYFSSFRKGYDELESFQERTYLYARPYLFERKARLGLIFHGNGEESGSKLIPFYFQWSTGQPYRFQSLNSIGSKAHEFLPNLEPVPTVRTDVKSHLFHATFIGNLFGLPAGESLFLHRDNFTMSREATVQPSFNYLGLMGADYGPFSLSFGFYYPTFGIKVRAEEREVLGSSLSYALRTMMTLPHMRFRTLLSYTDYDRKNPSKDDLLSRSNGQEATPPAAFDFHALFLRGGVDYDWTERIRISLDGVFVGGKFNEIRAGTNNSIRFNRTGALGTIKHAFGSYVTVSVSSKIFFHNYDARFSNEVVNKEEKETIFFGSLEFIF